MTLALVLFCAVSVFVTAGALVVVTTRNIVYAALGLLVTMVGTAGVFLLAFAEFLALVQLLIYGGAVVIVVLFALMLTRIEDFRHLSNNRQQPVATVIALGIFAVLVAAIINTPFPVSERTDLSLFELGERLFVDWAVPFEVASLVLLVALIGAVVLVRADDSGREIEEEKKE